MNKNTLGNLIGAAILVAYVGISYLLYDPSQDEITSTNENTLIASFQFNVNGGITVDSAYGGVIANFNLIPFEFTIEDSLVIGMSIDDPVPQSAGTLVDLALTGIPTGISEIIISDSEASTFMKKDKKNIKILLSKRAIFFIIKIFILPTGCKIFLSSFI